MAPALVTIVLYTRGSGTTFDLDYYLNKHIPLAKEIWGPYGMKIHSVSGLQEQYHLSTVIEWEHTDSYERAQHDERTKDIETDIASGNFSNSKPVLLMGNLVG